MKITLSILSIFLLLGCNGEEKAPVKHQTEAKAEKKVVEVKHEAPAPLAKKVEEKVTEVKQEAVEKVTEAKQEVVEKVTEIKQETEQKATEATQAVAEVKQEAVAVVESTQKDGSAIYIKCKSCHGANAEKKALGKSQIIAGWDIQKTTDAIKGYQNGTYGGAMKGLMAGQVKSLSDEDIAALAAYIAKQ